MMLDEQSRRGKRGRDLKKKKRIREKSERKILLYCPPHTKTSAKISRSGWSVLNFPPDRFIKADSSRLDAESKSRI